MSARHPLSPKQIKELLDTLAPGNGSAYQKRCSIRNKCIALLMLDAGCRACELCSLTSTPLTETIDRFIWTRRPGTAGGSF